MIIVTKGHEKSLTTNVLLRVLKKIRKKRRKLRTIISSATLQAEDFSSSLLMTNSTLTPSLKPSNNGQALQFGAAKWTTLELVDSPLFYLMIRYIA